MTVSEKRVYAVKTILRDAPWKGLKEVAHELGVSTNLVSVTLHNAGETFHSIKRKRIMELHAKASAAPQLSNGKEYHE